MSIIGKKEISYLKQDRSTDRLPTTTGLSPVVFAHKFTSAGQTDIDLNNLNTPTAEMTGFSNPLVSKLLASEIYAYPHRVRLVSSVKGQLMPYLSYTIPTNSTIRLAASAPSANGEIIIGTIAPVPVQGVSIADAKPIVQTGTLAVGATDFLVNEYFEVNKYSDQQVGDVIVIRDGVIQQRNVGNTVSGAGDYYEIPPAAGTLSNTIRFKTAPVGAAAKIAVISTGLKTERQAEGTLARVGSLAGQLDKVITDLAPLAGKATSYYQAAPNDVDTKLFGDRVQALLFDLAFDLIVGSSAFFNKGFCSHTSVQAAIDAAQAGDRILVLQGTYAENLVINKKVTLIGKGHETYINGTVTFQGSSDYSAIDSFRIGGNLTLQAGADGIFVRNCWLTSSATLTDSGSGNSLLVIQE